MPRDLRAELWHKRCYLGRVYAICCDESAVASRAAIDCEARGFVIMRFEVAEKSGKKVNYVRCSFNTEPSYESHDSKHSGWHYFTHSHSFQRMRCMRASD